MMHRTPAPLRARSSSTSGRPRAPRHPTLLIPGAALFFALAPTGPLPAPGANAAEIPGPPAVRVSDELIVNKAVVEGDIRVDLPISFQVNAGAEITGGIRVPGSPALSVHRGAALGAIREGDGNADPDDHRIRLGNRTTVGWIETRVDGEALPEVDPPPAPQGTETVRLNRASREPIAFDSLRDLHVNGNDLTVVMPPGTYGTVTLNGDNTLRLGEAGADAPAQYAFERLKLAGAARLELAGPVEIHLHHGTGFDGTLGNPDHPEWLRVQIYEDDVHFNAHSTVHGHVLAPRSRITVNAHSTVHGSLWARALTLNANGSITWAEGGFWEVNEPPEVDAGPDRTHELDEDYTIALEGVVTDDDLPRGAPLLIEWHLADGPGTVAFADPSDPATSAIFSTPGDYTLRLTADDSEFTVSDNVTHTIVQINRPPLFTSNPVTDVDEDVHYRYEVTADDPDLPFGDTIAITADTLPAWLTLTDHAGSTAVLEGHPRREHVGEHPVGLRVTDSAGDYALQGFTVHVHAVNHPPVAFDGALELLEDTSITFMLEAEDIDGDPLTFRITTLPDHGSLATATAKPIADTSFILHPSSFPIIYTPEPDYHGADRLRFVANDGELDSNEAIVVINIIPVNDPPSFTASDPDPVYENSDAQAIPGWAAFTPGPPNESDQSVLAYHVSNITDPDLFSEPPTVDTDGTLRFTPAPDTWGESDFTVRVQDDGGTEYGGIDTSEPQTFTITVHPTPRAHTWTTTEQFRSGSSRNLRAGGDSLFLASDSRAFNFLWIPITSKGTIVRVDADTGAVLGEYRTAPEGQPTNPSRTSVASDGSVWVGNRSGNTVTNIGVPPHADQADRLHTSRGLGDVLPWTNAGDADTNGGVSTAEDDLIRHYIPVRASGIRHVSVDLDNNVWVSGTGNRVWDLVDGETGAILREEPSVGYGGYGGLVDLNGILWSTRPLLWWDTAHPLAGPAGEHWKGIGGDTYGIALDSDGNAWVTSIFGNTIRKFSPDGDLINAYFHGGTSARGVVVDHHDQVWVAHTFSNTVGRLTTGGEYIGNVNVPKNPMGMAADAQGRIWAVSRSGVAVRIDRDGGPPGADGSTPAGAVDLQTDYLGGSIYAYSDMTGGSISRDPDSGTWTAVFDSGIPGAAWGPVTWEAELCSDSALTVTVATGEDGHAFGDPELLTLLNPNVTTEGRFIQVTVDFHRATTGESPTLRALTVGTIGYDAAAPSPAWHITAGPDITANWPDTYALRGAICSNDFPIDREGHFLWEQFDGPGTVAFADPVAPHTEATVSIDGDYLVQLTVEAMGEVRTDTVTLDLTPYNRAPWVDAGGPVYTHDSGDPVTLNGFVHDDGLPLEGELQIQWRKLHGPGSVAFADPEAPVTGAVFGEPGIHVLELEADDSELASVDRTEVRVATPCSVDLTDTLAAWWPANGTPEDIVRGNTAELKGNATFGDGKVSMGFSFPDDSALARIPAHPSVDIGAAEDGFTVEYWIRASERGNNTHLEWDAPGGLRIAYSDRSFDSHRIRVTWADEAGVPHALETPRFDNRPWTHVAVFYDRTAGVLAIYRNGLREAVRDAGDGAFATAGDLLVGGGDPARRFRGAIDELSLHNQPLPPEAIWSIYASDTIGKCRASATPAPNVDAGPDNGIAAPGGALPMQGSVTQDGLSNGNPVRTAWRQLSGPGEAEFWDISDPNTEVTFPESGVYELELWASNAFAEASDTVTIRVGTHCAIPAGDALVAWWPGDSHFDDVAGGFHGQPIRMRFDPGKAASAFAFDGEGFVRVPAAPDLELGASGDGFTIEYWARAFARGNTTHFAWNETGGLQIGYADRDYDKHRLRVAWTEPGGAPAALQTASFDNRPWSHFAVTYDRVAGTLSIYQNGLRAAHQAVGDIAFPTAADLLIGGGPDHLRFQGNIDEISLYNRPLLPEEIWSIYAGDGSGKCLPDGNIPPIVDAGPDTGIHDPDLPLALQGSVTDDGLPRHHELVIGWRQLSGPEPVTFADPADPKTTATFGTTGVYELELWATDGLAEASDTVTLRVGTHCAIPAGDALVAWWPGDSHFDDVGGGFHGQPIRMGFDAGKAGSAFAFDSEGFVRVPAAPELELGASGDGFTIEYWARAFARGNTTHFAWNETGGLQIAYADRSFDSHRLRVAWTEPGGAPAALQTAHFDNRPWSHFAVTYDRAAGTLSIYRNGLRTAHQPVGDVAFPTAADLLIGGGPDHLRFQGNIDEISLYNRPLLPEEIWSIYAGDGSGKCHPDGNIPPMVDAGPDTSIEPSETSIALQGAVVDDGRPGHHPVRIEWRALAGSGVVAFDDASDPQTTAHFTEPGIYTLELWATDGLAAASDTVTIRYAAPCAVEVHPSVAAWWPADHTFEDRIGEARGGPVNVGFTGGVAGTAWSFDGNAFVRVPAADAIDLGAPDPGFTIEYWIRGTARGNRPHLAWNETGGLQIAYSDRSWDSHRIRVAWTNPDGDPEALQTARFDNRPWTHIAVVHDRPAQTLRIFRNGSLAAQRSMPDARLPTAGDLYIGGTVAQSHLHGILDELTFYSEPLDSSTIAAIHAAGAAGKCPPPPVNQPPVVDAGAPQTITLPETAALNGTVIDDGLPADGTLTTLWERVDGPAPVAIADPGATQTEVTFTEPGEYRFQLTADDGELIAHDETTVSVLPDPRQPPVVAILSPADGTVFEQGDPIDVSISAFDPDGTVVRVELFLDGAIAAVLTEEPWSHTITDLPEGAYTLHARATDNDGLTATSEPVEFQVYIDSGPPEVILHLDEGTVVTAPTPVYGTIQSALLDSWRLEHRAAGGDEWTAFATGSAEAANKPLGTLDPTLLRNGIYHLRLSASDITGRTAITPEVGIVVVDNMKVGHFSLAFEDFNVPVSGVPIRVIRTYDSRDATPGDFGPGWSVALNTVRLQKNTSLAFGWTVEDTGLITCPLSIGEEYPHIITITFPDDETFRFAVRPINKNLEGQPEHQQNCFTSFGFIPVKLVFDPVGRNADASLAVVGSDEAFFFPGDGLYYEDGFTPYDPSRFRLTTQQGTEFVIDEHDGLLEMRDRNDNTLTVHADGVSHSSGRDILFTRDPSGRIATATGPDGSAIHYDYDPEGRLASVTDRTGNTTGFRYDNPDHPHYLTEILDPRGVRALRNEYDDDGRLVRQIDAHGNAIAFEHALSDRFQRITDRLGHTTIHDYDERGNITRTIDPLGHVTSYTYDERGNQLTETGPLGHTTTFTYDTRGNLLTETGPDGNTTSFTYDPNGNPLSVTDALGNTTSFAYDGRGNLTQQIDALGNITTYNYDSSGNLTATTDPEGNTTQHAYDGAGNRTLTVVLDAGGHELRRTSFTYDTAGNQTSQSLTRTVHDIDGNPAGTEELVTEFEYDAEGRLIRTIHQNGSTTQTEYDDAGLEIRNIDELGRITEHVYDSRGNRIRTIHEDATFTEWIYDAEGRVTSESLHDADSSVIETTAYEYDPLGRRTAAIRATGTDAAAREETVYDALGRTVAEIDPNGNTTAYEYDDACGCSNRRTAVIDPLGNRTAFSYDAAGNRTAVTDARGHTTDFEYDALGRLVTTIHPAPEPGAPRPTTGTEYDALGRRSAAIDELGRRTAFRYDPLGNLTEIRQPHPDDSTTSQLHPSTTYRYDQAGNRIAQTDALGRTTRFQYDGRGRRTARIKPMGQIEFMEYDAAGRMIARTDFEGHTTTFTYDDRDRLLSETADPAHPSLNLPHAPYRHAYTYDAAGRRTASRVHAGPLFGEPLLYDETCQYDARGNLVKKDTPHGALHYSYDAAGNLTGTSSDNPDGLALAFTHDPLNRLDTVYDHGARHPPAEHRYTYNAAGSVASIEHGAESGTPSITHTYTYNPRNQLTQLEIRNSSLILHTSSFALNALGHRTQIEESAHSAGSGSARRTRYFAYDRLNRLVQEVIADDPHGFNGSLNYTYDAVGNRLRRDSTLTGIPSETYSYDDNDRLLSDHYDANGNTLTSTRGEPPVAGSQDIYDFKNRLARRTTATGDVIDLQYDTDGNRIVKTVNGAKIHYLVDTNNHTGYVQVVEELSPSSFINHPSSLVVVRTYTHGLTLLSQSQLIDDEDGPSWHSHYYLLDGQNSVCGLADLDGTLTDLYYYEAYGSLINHNGHTMSAEALSENGNLYQYTGEQWDPDLNHYYLRARYYEPNRGRFWTMDPFQGFLTDPQSLHKYSYAHNNPVMFVDPSGKFTISEVTVTNAIVGFTAGFVAGASKGIISHTVMAVRCDSIELDDLDLKRVAFDSFRSGLTGAFVAVGATHVGVNIGKQVFLLTGATNMGIIHSISGRTIIAMFAAAQGHATGAASGVRQGAFAECPDE